MNKKAIVLFAVGLLLATVYTIWIIDSFEEDACRMNNEEWNNLTYPISLNFLFGEYAIGCPEYINNKFYWGSPWSR